MPPRIKQDEIPYHDVRDIPEQYADHLQTISLGGQVATLTFSVTRVEEAGADNPRHLARYTSSRLVIPTTAFVELYSKLTRLMNMLETQGALKRQPPSPTTIQ